MQETELKNLHYILRCCRIQNNKTDIGLHGKEEKLNLSKGEIS